MTHSAIWAELFDFQNKLMPLIENVCLSGYTTLFGRDSFVCKTCSQLRVLTCFADHKVSTQIALYLLSQWRILSIKGIGMFGDERVSTQIALCSFSQWRTLLIKSICMFWRSKSFDPNSDILVFSFYTTRFGRDSFVCKTCSQFKSFNMFRRS